MASLGSYFSGLNEAQRGQLHDIVGRINNDMASMASAEGHPEIHAQNVAGLINSYKDEILSKQIPGIPNENEAIGFVIAVTDVTQKNRGVEQHLSTPIMNVASVSQIEANVYDESSRRQYPLSVKAREDVARLTQVLGEAAIEVTPQFAIEQGKAVIVGLDTGPGAMTVKALNKLNGLLTGSGMRKTQATHGFDAAQTQYILENLPPVGAQIAQG